MKTISIVIPAFNEGKSIAEIIQKVLLLEFVPAMLLEIIVVDDCSTDDTYKIVQNISNNHPEVVLIRNSKNLGKSQSVKKGILKTTGDFVVIQDADNEYNPQDLLKMFRELQEGNHDVCYGNRFGKNNGMIYPKNFYGNLFLSFFSNLFTIGRIKVSIPDMEVCYKMIKGDVIRDIAKSITSTSNFGFEPEVTARLSRKKKTQQTSEPLSFVVIPIDYKPRTYEEGKKMKAYRDGIKTLFEIIKYNIF